MKKRQAGIKRETAETQIILNLSLDGSGRSEVSTGVKFFDHMLELFAFHGLFDLKVIAKGDLDVDRHHTLEDVGIALGEAFKRTLGQACGIKRFGFAFAPMDEALARVVLDISGRGSLSIKELCGSPLISDSKEFQEATNFLEAFAKKAGINLHIGLLPKQDVHHQLEAIFKALGIALCAAVSLQPRRKGVPSTKGLLDL
jgi:imidazoleglycerol-phosphate dehydratase